MTARKRSANGATPISSLVTAMQAPAAKSLAASQRVALEGARFWARRMRSYADQMEALARCADVTQFAEVQAQFLEKMREDYVSETAAFKKLWEDAQSDADEQQPDGG